jgi:transcriptional regulator with XRE-family HTH domain
MSAHPLYKSQQTLGKASGVGQTSIGRMRRGEGSATIDNVQKVAKAFRLTASDLLDPRLLSRVQVGTAPDTLARAYEVAAVIQSAGFNANQLTLLETTVAALRGSQSRP